ncbi:hypothetical protein SADUNF_Sadunf06G0023900 [Salix dunnii]|uniref:Uncharacterized protein n=1 Tax=Salix dunnii TaxID=1413687 RepID=A0A835K2Q6_9ROSI|nr:hypothetical protein SADUNF_Sadunf06G0023900 [Salix dunnii]
MSQLETPCQAVGYGKFSSVKGGSGSELKNNPAMSNSIGGLKSNANKDAFAEISTVNVSGSLTDVYESLDPTLSFGVDSPFASHMSTI